MAKKLLYAMRHCETLFNVQGKTQGWCDSPVTDRGREQCRIAGEEIVRRGLTFDHAYCSTSERCCDTLEMVTAAAFGEPMAYERKKDLRECSFGAYEGKDDYLEPPFSMPEIREQVIVASGGESDAQISERMNRCLGEIMARDDHQSVLVVGSGGSLVRFYFDHKSTARDEVKAFGNCMTYVYEWEDGVFSLVEAFIPDFSSLEAPGMPSQVRTMRD